MNTEKHNMKDWFQNIQEVATSADARFPNLPQSGTQAQFADSTLKYEFYRIKEIREGKAEQYRMAMANVLSNLAGDNRSNSIVYILSGKPEGVDLYIGVAGQHKSIVSEDAEMLKQSFEGNFLGAVLEKVRQEDDAFNNLLSGNRYTGIVTGIPSFNEQNNQVEGEDFQSIERLVNTMGDCSWQMVIVAEPGDEADIDKALSNVYELSSRLSEKIKYSLQQSENEGVSKSVTEGKSQTKTEGSNSGTSDSRTQGTNHSRSDGTNETDTYNGSSGSSSESSSSSKTKGTSDSRTKGVSEGKSLSVALGTNSSESASKNQGKSFALTREKINKHLEQIQSYLDETQGDRFRLGLSKGMFRASIYLCAGDLSVYERLSRSVLAIFQGDKAGFTPLRIHRADNLSNPALAEILQVRYFENAKYIKDFSDGITVHSIPEKDNRNLFCATWLNTKELSLLTGLPGIELSGIKLRKSVSFAVNTVDSNKNIPTVKLGSIIQDGRKLESKRIEIPTDVLNKHVFVTGVTGAGKTTTCMKLLLESGFPFVVIEPAKTEYRALNQQIKGVQYYSLGREDLTTFRMNPFELVSKHQNLTGHISMLKATMAAVFPMEASMPFIVESAIIQAYQNKGWDIASNSNYLVDDPWHTEENVWPTFSDMIGELDSVIQSAGMGKEFEEKYKGSLVSRLESLTKGIRGTMINTPRSIDFDKLLDQKVVIELDELKDEEDKAFFMGLIIGRLAECMKQRHRTDNNFKHITLVEEAHRLLSRPEPGADGSKKLGVEMFANLLAEVRKYGECLVIADQIPNKLVTDVIKNTNTKIIHRLFAADDRNSIGDAMSLNDDQKDFLPLLNPGETVVYSGGWHAPVRAQIDQLVNTIAEEIEEDEIRKIGQEQLWIQSAHLFPSVRRLNHFHNAADFAAAVSAGRQFANMLLRIAALRYENKGSSFDEEKDGVVVNKIAGRMAAVMKQAKQELSLSASAWCETVAAILKDAQPNSILQNPDEWALVGAALAAVVEELESPTEGLIKLATQERERKQVFKGFTTLRMCALI